MSTDDRRHEREADERFFELCLDEQLGGRRPPDIAARVLGAGLDARQRAAESLERATRESNSDPRGAFDTPSGTSGAPHAQPSEQTRRGWLAVAAALIGVTAIWYAASRFQSKAVSVGLEHATHGPVAEGSGSQPSEASVTTPAPADALVADALDDSLQELLDRFHAAMPREPARLRDADERARVAPLALPVLRELIAYCAGARPATQVLAGAAEFEVYAVALGAADVRARVERRAAQGDSEAAFALHVAALIVADGAATRSDAMRALAARIEAHEPLTSAVARTLVAVDLDEQEFEQLLVRLDDERMAASLAREAAEARHDPRNWVGDPATFAGVTADGRTFSTASWRGKVIVVVLWASWCQPCHALLDAVVAARERHAARGLRVVGVSCDFEERELRAHLRANPRQDWPQLFDPTLPGWHELAVAHDVRSIPTAFVLGPDGVVHDVVRGADELDRALERLFGERPR